MLISWRAGGFSWSLTITQEGPKSLFWLFKNFSFFSHLKFVKQIFCHKNPGRETGSGFSKLGSAIQVECGQVSP
jgi:hypothetical protein